HQIGRDLAATGVNLNYAPVADVNRNPDNPVIGIRSFGADPQRVAAHVTAFVTGHQAAGVAACAKHFPGHGDTSVDSHRSLPVISDSSETLAAGALIPFQAAIAAGVKAIMSAHIVLSALDSEPATLSRRVLTGILRNELGYDGLIVTDAIEMAAIKRTYGLEEGAIRALAAGADVICIGGWRDAETTITRLADAVETAVRDGRLSEERLAEAATRARRTAQRDAVSDSPGDRGIGLAAARRAIRVLVPFTPLTDTPHVIELSPKMNEQIGDRTEWGLAAAQRFSGQPTDLRPIAAQPGRLVIVVRDAHRHGWITATVRDLLALRPDAIVVEMGLPHGDPPPNCGGYLATYGAGRASGIAAAEALQGRHSI
ncbi:MAG TPA: sugar hydrolase, partial [Micromonosporaceae bacterium]|nr:sugar hydrolase [Micromonosporaceae bacterium]